MDLLVDVGLDPDVRCSWARLTEYLPTTDVLQTLKSSKTLTELVLDGVEAVTDEVFFMLQRERLGFSITHVSCIGCIHITDYGVSLLAQAAPALKTVVFDGCPQLTAASLYHLSRSCKQLSSVSARGSSITHMPIPIPLAPDGLLACPLITDDANYIEPTKSKRYKIAIFVKNTIKTSVLSFLTSGFFDKQAEKNDLITYHSDVTLDNVVDFTFNIIECHLPRGMYSPFLSARGAYIFAMDLGTVENPLVHLNTLTSCIRGQVVNSTVQVLCLHCGQPEEYAGIVDLAEGLRLAEIRQKDTISQGLDDMYSHEYNPNIKIDREMITQVRHMRGRKHFSGRLVINIFAVNTENLEVEIVWPKRDTTGNIVTETEGEKQLNSAPAEVDVDADNMFSQINTGYSAEDLYAEMEDLQEQANRLLDEATVDLVRINGHLSSLNKKDISEIKSFKTPPIQIGTCMGVLAILLGYPSDRKLGHASWTVVRQMLQDMHFITKLTQFDKENLTGAHLKFLKEFTEDPDMKPSNMMKYSTCAGVCAMWMHGIYDFIIRCVIPIRPIKDRMNAITASLDKIKSSRGLIGKGPALIQGVLRRDLTVFHNASPQLHLPPTPTMTAVHVAVAACRERKVLSLEDLLQEPGLGGKFTVATVSKVLEYMHDTGDVVFFPDVPTHPVVTDLSWLMDVLTQLHRLPSNAKHLLNMGRVRIFGPEHAIFTQADFSTYATLNSVQVSLLFPALESAGILIRIPAVYLGPLANTSKAHYFYFGEANTKPYIWEEGVTGGKHSDSRLVQNFWSDAISDESVMTLEYCYKFTAGLPLQLLPRILGEFSEMGFCLTMYRWGILVRHGACELRLTHNIHLSLLTSSLDIELRTLAVSPTHILYEYMWSVFSNYLLIIEYQAHRFPNLLVQAKQPCRGSCAQKRFPHRYFDHELPRRVGHRMPCAKCQEDSMDEEQNFVMIGRRHILPYHNMVDGTDVTAADNPHAPYNYAHQLPDVGSQANWRCFVCHTVQTASLRLWSYEASLSPALAISCIETQDSQLTQEGNILRLNKNISRGVAVFKEPFITTGVTALSITPLSKGKVTLALGIESSIERCMKTQDVADAWDIFELHTGRLINQRKGDVEELEPVCPFEELTLKIVAQRYVETHKGITQEKVELQLSKNGSEITRKECVYPLHVALMLEEDGTSTTQVVFRCQTYPTIRAHHFPLKGVLLYKQLLGQHWTLGEVMGTASGKVLIGDSQDPTQETYEFDPGSENILPITCNMSDMTIVIGKDILRKSEEYRKWIDERCGWPVQTCVFSKFIASKSKSDFNEMKLGSFTHHPWRCSASRHSPEVLHATAITQKASQINTKNRHLSKCCILLPTGLYLHRTLRNPHRNVAHNWSQQSLHLVCPGTDIYTNRQVKPDLSSVSDYHFLGVPPVALQEEEARIFMAAYPHALTYTYICLLKLKNVLLPFEGCANEDIEEVERDIKGYMHTYLATTILIGWLQRFPGGLQDWINTGSAFDKQHVWMKLQSDALVNGLLKSHDILSTKEEQSDGRKDKRANRKRAEQLMCPSHLAVNHLLPVSNDQEVNDHRAKFNVFVRSLVGKNILPKVVMPYLQVLSNLVTLDLEKCNLSALPGLGACPRLASLKLSTNLLTMVPPDVSDLCATLQELDLTDNLVTTIPAFLTECTELISLSLSFIRELPEDFGNLYKLKMLVLDNALITKLPDSFRKLKHLEHLTIRGVAWKSLRNGVFRSHWRQCFTTMHANVTLGVSEEFWMKLFDDHDLDNDACLDSDELPAFNQAILKAYPRLGKTEAEAHGDIGGGDSDGAEIKDESRAKAEANSAMDSVHDEDSEDGMIPTEIFACRRLRILRLQYTAIRIVPSSIEHLQKLIILNFENNLLLENINIATGKLKKLKELNVRLCPMLRTPPREIVSQGNAALIAYLRRLSQGSVACFRTKLMFVGLGGAGKTSLMRALMSKDGRSPEVKGEGITDGIDISNWTVPHKGETLTFNVWDFAGQTVYYNTHQFFLSKRAVYILVWNTRLGYEHSGLDFWLASIACHTPKTPVFIVGTHADQISKSEIPQQKLKKRFPNIVSFMKVSSRNGEGVLDLLSQLADVTLAQPYIGERIPEAWLSLEKLILSQRSRSSMMDWNQVCATALKAAISGLEVRRAVLFLHELGILQYFDNELLRDRVVINPQWIVDVMACVVSVHHSPIMDGHLAHSDMAVIWKEYNADLHDWLLRLTEVFDLTFPLPNRAENVVPCLLPKEEPQISWPVVGEGIIEMKMVYRFDYLPAGLFNRAQARLYEFSDYSSMWKEGSVLKKGGHMALIKQTKDNEVTVRAVGVKPENVILLVHEVFEGLISEFFQGVKYEYHLPCVDCIKMDLKEPAMFSSRIMQRAVQLRALFLQCHAHFHTLSMSTIQQSLLPSSNADYALQLESAIRGLDDLHDDLAYDVFLLYSAHDVPGDVMDSNAVHPERIKNDLYKVGIKCLYEDNLEGKEVTELLATMKNCKTFLIFISDHFVVDKHCQRLFTHLMSNMSAEYVLAMVGKGRDWQQSNLGMKVSSEVYINFQRMKQYEERLQNLTQKLLQKLGRLREGDMRTPDVFLSYCWSNSATSIAEGIARPKEGSVGAGDPRQLKSFMEDNGLKVWLDLEQTGKAGLFEDITAGMKKAKVVVACVSDEYVLSTNCQMEFRFAHIALRMPIVIVVVGTGFQWEATEVGMLSLGYPKLNMVVANNLAHNQLLEHVRERVNSTLDVMHEERPISATSTNAKEMAFHELYELAQRKFLRQISSYVDQADSYPRLFVVDLNYDPSATTPPQKGDLDMDDLELEVNDGVTEAIPRLSVDDMESGMFCIKTLCEHEGGWHAAAAGITVDLGGSSLMKVWQMAAPYMARILAILKHSDVNLHIIQHPEGGRVLDVLEKRATLQPQVDLRPLYNLLRQYVMAKDHTRNRGGLARCYLPSGKVLWLCEEHRVVNRITVLTEEEVCTPPDLGAETPEVALMAGLAAITCTDEDTSQEESGAPMYTRPISVMSGSNRSGSARPVSKRVTTQRTPDQQQNTKMKTKPPSTKPPTTKPSNLQPQRNTKTPVTSNRKDIVQRPQSKDRSGSGNSKASTKKDNGSSVSIAREDSNDSKSSARVKRRVAGSGMVKAAARPATQEERRNVASKIAANVSTGTISQACVIL